MKKKTSISTLLATLLLSAGMTHAATILNPTDSRIVSQASTQTTENFDTGAGVSESYVIRTRSNTGQTDRIIATFIRFDVSSLTISEVNSPGFYASFDIDYVSSINDNEEDHNFDLGRNTIDDWTWDSSGDNNPLYSWIDDVGSVGTFGQFSGASTKPQSLTLDITSTVQGWVNDDFDNLGLILYGNAVDPSHQNGFGFTGAEINIVPEPSSVVLLGGLGILCLLRRRR